MTINPNLGQRWGWCLLSLAAVALFLSQPVSLTKGAAAAGAPKILGLVPETARIEGGTEVILTGSDFTSESVILLGDQTAGNVVVESATRIRFTVPKQNFSGTRTLTVQTIAGLDQHPFRITPKPLGELAPGEITTIAGGLSYVGDGTAATGPEVAFNPGTMAVDTGGNLFLVDKASNRIRRVDAVTGIITTVAGNGSHSSSGDGGPAITAGIVPQGLALDSAGNLFIADQYRIRRVDAQTQVITTVAGDGRGFGSGDGIPALEAGLRPTAVTIDQAGNLFITETFNFRVRRVDAVTGLISTVAGNGRFGFAGDGDLAIRASLEVPKNAVLDIAGNLYIPESTRVRRVDAKSGRITTVVGNGSGGFSGDGGPALNAGLFPLALAFDPQGNLLIVDSPVPEAFVVGGFVTGGSARAATKPANNRIRRVDAKTGVISTLAGNGSEAFSGDGGPATQAGMLPRHITVDTAGNLFIADESNRIRRVDAQTKIISTVAGHGRRTLANEGGPATAGGLSRPVGVARDKNGNLLVADSQERLVRRVDALTGVITTIAGNGSPVAGGDGGPATQAGLVPVGLAFDSNDNLFITDSVNHQIRRVDGRTGIMTTVAGNGQKKKKFGEGTFSGDGGPAIQAGLSGPGGVAVDPAGNLFIADTYNNRIRRVDAKTKTISTFAGNGKKKDKFTNFSGDGGLATLAGLSFPRSLAFDRAGTLFIGDSDRIRRVDPQTKIITTVAGSGNRITEFEVDDGLATRVNIFPESIALDGAGNLLLSDSYDLIRFVDQSTKQIATVAGKRLDRPDQELEPFTGDGGLARQARLNQPFDLISDGQGNLLIADSFNGVVRAVKGIAAAGPVGIGPAAAVLAINEGKYIEPALTLNGFGFGPAGAHVFINGLEVSRFITRQTDTTLLLTGTASQLNLRRGTGFITVTNAEGALSNRLGLVVADAGN